MTKILIADSCEEHRLGLSELLSQTFTVRCCSDGRQALDLLESFCPDLLVADLMLQQIDGLGVMQAARRTLATLPLVATSSTFPPYAVERLEELGVAYLVQKPCDLPYLAQRISDLANRLCVPVVPSASPFSQVTLCLLELGLDPGRTGFLYCREAILLLRENPTLRVTKELYPLIAKAHSTGPEAVEKSIRDAVAAAWRAGATDTQLKYFLPAANGQVPRPSNRSFLTTLTEQLFSVRREAL